VEDQCKEPNDELLDRAAEALRRAPIPPGPPAEAVDRVVGLLVQQSDIIPLSITERIRKMKRIARPAVAATILIALGILVSWIILGDRTANIAFAKVAEALDGLHSATYDLSSEVKGQNDNPGATATGKGFFLSPSHQRIEVSAKIDKTKQMELIKKAPNPAAKAAAEAVMNMPPMKHISIMDGQAAKLLMLMPSMKMAIAMDMKKMQEDMKKTGKMPKDAPPDYFELVRRLVREGNSSVGEKVENLGPKQIDGRKAVGFRVHNPMNSEGYLTVWADPETAQPIRIEFEMEMLSGARIVMNNFSYDVDLDASMFSLEPPAGYSTQTMNMTMPVEEDLLNTLRLIAEHNKGAFPDKLGMNEDVLKALTPEIDKKARAEENAEMNAAVKKIEAKYGGKEKLKAKYGKQLPPEIMAEIMEAKAPSMQKHMKETMPILQKRMQGIQFFISLKPENDSHYAGKGVKLGTPDRAIFWYKPAGADKYRVIHADLTVKEMTAEDVKKLQKTP
jgi:outer membrane lipoprotein-sorting protein